jgi:hypothetical protein
LVQRLVDLKATQRPVAQALGVGQATISRDLVDSVDSHESSEAPEPTQIAEGSDPHESPAQNWVDEEDEEDFAERGGRPLMESG